MDSEPPPPVTLTNALVLISGRHIPKALSVMSQFIGADRDTLAIEHDCTIRPTYSQSVVAVSMYQSRDIYIASSGHESDTRRDMDRSL